MLEIGVATGKHTLSYTLVDWFIHSTLESKGCIILIYLIPDEYFYEEQRRHKYRIFFKS